ncbi:MAG TPA: LysR family transcriptional regulator [Stellaceae bacterium]|nr:LysR family transcriptional regulator [Stellaceae bacterium]
MDRLEAMSTLLAVVEAGSLSAASRRLRTPLATVSRRISELEAHLTTRLLNRSTRRLTLTDAGEAYIEACRRILDQLDEAEHIAAGEYRSPTGELTVTASLVLGRRHAVPVAAAFLDAYPEVLLRLRLTDRVVSLQEEHVDIGIRIGALPDSSMVARQIGSVRLVTCASPAYLARRGRPETPRDLAAHDCVSFMGFVSPDAWNFQIGGATVPVNVRSRLTVDAAEAVLDAAIAGAGMIRLYSYHVADAVKDGRLVVLLEEFEPRPLPVNILYLGGLVPLKVRAFVDFAAPRLKSRLAGDLG